jgi:H+/Cl- antiporter ClcA
MRAVAWGLIGVGGAVAALAFTWWALTTERDYGTFNVHHPDFPWPIFWTGLVTLLVGIIVLAVRPPERGGA